MSGKRSAAQKSKGTVQRTLHTPKYTTFHFFHTLLFLLNLVFKFDRVDWDNFLDNFQLQNIILFVFFTKNAYLLTA